MNVTINNTSTAFYLKDYFNPVVAGMFIIIAILVTVIVIKLIRTVYS